MADLLPDIPADVFNNWSAGQFADAVGERISSLPGDISQGVQDALAPPPPPTPAPTPEPPPLPPEQEQAPEPAPPPPPPPTAAPPPDLTTTPLPPPPDLTTPPPPDLSAPAPAPDVSAPAPAPTPTPTPTPTPSPTPAPSSSSGFDPFSAALNAADAAGANMGQFASALGQSMSQKGGDVLSAALNAADAAGANMQQFATSLPSNFGAAAQQGGQAVGGAVQSLGIQGPTANTPGDLIDQARQAAQTAGIDPDVFARQIQQESGFNPNAKSGAGALGIAQFMPGTAQGLGIDPMDPVQALQAAAKMDAQNLQKYSGDWGKTLAAYNAGGGAVDKYGGIPPFSETQSYVKNILGGAQNVVQQAADTGLQAVNTVKDTAQAAAARTSQFAMGLSSGDAMAFCGPAAAMAFAESFGRNPTVEEAKQLAAQVGWNPSQGMAGPSSEVNLLKSLGIDTHMTSGVDWTQVAKDASSGNPVIIDTPGHYFYVDGYNADTGQYHFGTSATDLKASGGKEWFTPDQVASLGMGAPRAAIFADHPLSGAGVAAQQAVGGAQQAVSGVTQAAGAVGQQAQDTMSAVMNVGSQTAQDTLSSASDWLDSQKDKLSSKFQSAVSPAEQALDTVSGLGQSLSPGGILGAGARVGSLQPGQSTDLGPLSVGPMPSGNATIPLSIGGVDITRPYDPQAAVQRLLPDASPLVQQTVAGAANPLNVFFGPAGIAAGAAGGLGGEAAKQQVASMGGDATAQLIAALAGNAVAGGLSAAAVDRLGPAAVQALSDPAVQAALRYRQAGEADVNFAAGGVPKLVENIFGTTPPAEETLPEHAGNAARAVYNAAVEANTAPATGADTLSRVLGDLGSYPEEVAGPIRDWAQSTQAPASDVANTVWSWMRDNPLPSAAAETPSAPTPVTDITAARAARSPTAAPESAAPTTAAPTPTAPTPTATTAAPTPTAPTPTTAAPTPTPTGGGGAPPPTPPPTPTGGGGGTPPPGGRPPPGSTAAPPSGNIFSRFGQLVASAMSPTENLDPVAQRTIQDYAKTVGRDSNAAAVIATSDALRTGQAMGLPAGSSGLGPGMEKALADGIRKTATDQLTRDLSAQGLAVPVTPGTVVPSGWRLGSDVANSPLAKWAFDPSVAGPVRNVTAVSGIARSPLGQAILKTTGTTKNTIYALSNFHTITEGLNAAFSSPQALANYTRGFFDAGFARQARTNMADVFDNASSAGVTGLKAAFSPDVTATITGALKQRLVAGTVGGVGGGAAGYTEAKVAGRSDEEAWRDAAIGAGLGAVLGATPTLARGATGARQTVPDILNAALWERAVPLAKATAWDGLVRGGMGPSEAADVINQRFGGLNYAAMGRSQTLQDSGRIGLQAMDWNESTVRQLGSLIGGPGAGASRAFLARTIGGMLATTEVANLALSGHSTLQNQPGHQFEVEVPTPEGGYAHVGILPGNIQSYLNLGNKVVSDPGAKRLSDITTFGTGRLSEPVRLLAEAGQTATAGTSAGAALREPYAVSKGGPVAGLLSSLSPVGISQVMQGSEEGGINPLLAIALATTGLNPRYTSAAAAQAAGATPTEAPTPGPVSRQSSGGGGAVSRQGGGGTPVSRQGGNR